MSDIKIGDTVFMFDINRRKYGPDRSGPVYREHFYPVTVTGETSRSWIVGPNYAPIKVSKKNPWAVLATTEMVEEAVWVETNRYKIERAVGALRDADKLRQIAAIVGYQP